jgi:hypothetical protein
MTNKEAKELATQIVGDGNFFITNKEAKELAAQIVGDGQTPNKFFVTTYPHIVITDESGDPYTEQLIDGYTDEDVVTNVFDTYEDAEYYLDNEVDLDINSGVGMAIIEDRLTGTINEIYLEKVVEVTYHMRQNNDAKLFGYTN